MTEQVQDTLCISGLGAPYLGDALLPLIHQEALMLQSRESLAPGLHFWRHRKALLLGSRDLVLPGQNEALQWVRAQGIASAVRPFGGQAVLLDCGVQNVTLITPDEGRSLDATFTSLATLLAAACAPVANVEVGEVSGSYCPGRFDLSIDGRKVAGIAQRRLSGVVAVSAFVNVRASVSREDIVARYYGLAGEKSTDGVAGDGMSGARARSALDVVRGSTTSLEDVLRNRGREIWTTEDFRRQCRLACERSGYRLVARPPTPWRHLEAAVYRLRR